MEEIKNNEESEEKVSETTELQQTTNLKKSDSESSQIQENNQSSSDIVFISTESEIVSSSENNSKTSSSSNKQVDSKPPASPISGKYFEDLDASENVIEVVEEITVGVPEEQDIVELFNVESPSEEAQLNKGPNTEIHESQPTQESLLKSKKGPPALLPLDQNSPTPDSPEVRVPRRAALKSAEKTKIIAQVQQPHNQSSGKRDVLQESMEMANNDSGSVTVHKIKDPSFDLCRGCNKPQTCIFECTGRKGQHLQFCSKKCVQGFFKTGDVHYANSREKNGGGDKDNSFLKIKDSLQVQDHIVIEPDIEIQTLSDEYQMDFDGLDQMDSESSGGVSTISNASTELIEKAARESLCCCSCRISLYDRTDVLVWESMEFCSENCLKTYVKVIGSHCNMCNSQVGEHNLGKLCVRFGTVIRQFCTTDCLEKFKSSHKLCSQCQVNMLDKDKTYCSQSCSDLAARLKNKEDFFGRRHCAVCSEFRPITEEVYLSGRSHWLCSKPCRNAFLFANKATALSCGICCRSFDVSVTPRFVSRNAEKGLLTQNHPLIWYCSNVCFATRLLKMRKIELCARCQVKKYNVDMIRKPTGDVLNNKGVMEAQMIFFCSIYCYTHYMTPSARDVARRKVFAAPPNPFPGTPPSAPLPVPPVILSQPTSVSTLLSNSITLQPPARPLLVFNHPPSTQVPVFLSSAPTPVTNTAGPSAASVLPIELNHKIVFVPPKPKEMKNKSVWCRPSNFSQNVSENQLGIDQATVDQSVPDAAGQSEEDKEKRPLYIPIPIPIPVPIYVPVPMAMYNFPAPYPVGLPVITPILLPVDFDLFAKMMKEMKESKKTDETTTPSTEDEPAKEKPVESDDSTNARPSNADIIDNSIKEENDLTNEKTANDSSDASDESNLEIDVPSCSILLPKTAATSRKRSHSTSVSSLPTPKRLKDADSSKSSSDSEGSFKTTRSESPNFQLSGGFQKELGMKAWTDWIGKSKRPITPKLKEMNIQEMNSSLISFMQDLRKPDGDKYRPDVLLYFICGLQQTFGADLRRQNLLMDAALLPFQMELDKELKPFYDILLKGIKADITMEVTTSLKESHLWKCRQLGVDSPIVLVFTMLYFNTKYFRLYTPEQHRSMAFTNVHKVPKKPLSNGSTGKMATKVFALQFVPMMEQAQCPKFVYKKPLEMPQNIDHPSHCPIKHYNFYLSKCPESMKARKDMFYLMPEKTSTPESPLWYSSEPVPQEILARMLRRVLLIEEVLRNLCASE